MLKMFKRLPWQTLLLAPREHNLSRERNVSIFHKNSKSCKFQRWLSCFLAHKESFVATHLIHKPHINLDQHRRSAKTTWPSMRVVNNKWYMIYPLWDCLPLPTISWSDCPQVFSTYLVMVIWSSKLGWSPLTPPNSLSIPYKSPSIWQIDLILQSSRSMQSPLAWQIKSLHSILHINDNLLWHGNIFRIQSCIYMATFSRMAKLSLQLFRSMKNFSQMAEQSLQSFISMVALFRTLLRLITWSRQSDEFKIHPLTSDSLLPDQTALVCNLTLHLVTVTSPNCQWIPECVGYQAD